MYIGKYTSPMDDMDDINRVSILHVLNISDAKSLAHGRCLWTKSFRCAGESAWKVGNFPWSLGQRWMNGCDVDDRMNKHLQLYNDSYIEAFEGTSRDKNSALKWICCFFWNATKSCCYRNSQNSLQFGFVTLGDAIPGRS